MNITDDTFFFISVAAVIIVALFRCDCRTPSQIKAAHCVDEQVQLEDEKGE